MAFGGAELFWAIQKAATPLLPSKVAFSVAIFPPIAALAPIAALHSAGPIRYQPKVFFAFQRTQQFSAPSRRACCVLVRDSPSSKQRLWQAGRQAHTYSGPGTVCKLRGGL